MKKGKLRKRNWDLLQGVTAGELDLRFNWPLRMRNALLALSRMDPSWICWVERNVPVNLSLKQQTRLIERQARALSTRGYGFSKYQWLAIVYSDTPFSERGLLPC